MPKKRIVSDKERRKKLFEEIKKRGPIKIDIDWVVREIRKDRNR